MPRIEGASVSGNVIIQPSVTVDILTLTGDPDVGGLDTPSALSYVDTILADGPIAYWRLGDAVFPNVTAIDRIAGRDGSAVGGASLGAAGLLIGDADTCVSMDGSAPTYISVPDDDIFSFVNGGGDLPFSLEAWIDIDLLGDIEPIISKSDVAGLVRNEYTLQVSDSGKVQFLLYSGGTSSNLYLCETTGTPIIAGNVYHVVATYDGGGVNGALLYINSVPVAISHIEVGTYVQMTNTATIVTLGARFYTDPTFKRFLNGDEDETAIYDKVLTPTETLTHYNAGI